jgi:hypothetical protein
MFFDLFCSADSVPNKHRKVPEAPSTAKCLPYDSDSFSPKILLFKRRSQARKFASDLVVPRVESLSKRRQPTLESILRRVPTSDDSAEDTMEENLERQVRPSRVVDLENDPLLMEIEQLYSVPTVVLPASRYNLRHSS